MSDKTIALITGGSRGLGRDMALKLAKKGTDIILTYHSNKSAAEKVVEEIQKSGQRAFALPLDTSNIKGFNDFFKKLGNCLENEFARKDFDFLINNAGTGLNKTISETTEEEFDDMLNIHFKGVFFFTQKALPVLNEGGRIINISSGLTRFSFPGSSVYASMKGAIEVFTRYLAKELGGRKITANVIAPGAIATDFGGGTNRDNEEKREIISNLTALGKVGEPEDIGGIVAFLCTPEGSWINGQRIEVSGGMLV